MTIEHRTQQGRIAAADRARDILLCARLPAREHQHRRSQKRYCEKRLATARHLQSPAHDLRAFSALLRRTDNCPEIKHLSGCATRYRAGSRSRRTARYPFG